MLWLGLHFFELELEVFTQASSNTISGDESPNKGINNGINKGINKSTNKTQDKTNSKQSTEHNPEQKAEQKAEQNSKPTVILANNKVVCRNPQAIQAGILPGATLATAHTIATDLVHHHQDPVRDHNALTALAESLYQLSSHISIQPPNGLILEVSRSLKLFRSSHRLQAKAVKLCDSLEHKVCARLANTPAAAMALARSGETQLEEVALNTLVQQQPSPLAKNPAANRNAFTDTLVERCHNMGIYQLGPLLALPTQELGRRFGKPLLQHLQQLTGERADPQRFIVPTQEFSQALHLLDPVRNKGGLRFPMQRLATQLQHWLIGRELAVQQIRWAFNTHDTNTKQPILLDIKFANPQRMNTALLSITQLKLERQDLPADILSLSLTAVQLLPWQEQSKDLFQLLSKNKSCNTRSDLVDQLRARLGDDVCETLTVQDQHHPQWTHQAQRVEQAVAKRPTTKSTTSPKATGRLKKSRPLWLLPEPKPLTTKKAQQPELVLLQGPERIRTGWWEVGIFRDYYVARLANGAHGWVFVDAQQQWYLHGYFS